MKKKLIGLGIIGLIMTIFLTLVAIGAVSYRHEADSIWFSGIIRQSNMVRQDWTAPTWVAGTGWTITANKSRYKIDTSTALGYGGQSAPGEYTAKSGATVILPTVTPDMDGWECTFTVISGTTAMWFKPVTGTICTTSGTTSAALLPNLTGDSVTFVACYVSGVSYIVKSSYIQ